MTPKLNLTWRMKLTALAVVLLIGAGGWRVRQGGAEAREQQTSPDLLIATQVAHPKNLQSQVQPRNNAPALAMATITVTNANDGPAPGPVGSLRRAINDAIPGDTINFNLPNPSTITLTNGNLFIDKSLIINGPGATALTIDGNSNERVFWLVNAPQVSFSGLTITNGLTDFGGGINSQNSTLSVDNCAIVGNRATSGAAGINIHTGSIATITNSTISGNISNGQSGGIQVNNATATLTNCTISGNTGTVATGVTGLDTSSPTTVTLINCTVANHSPHGVFTQGATIRLQNTLVANNTQNFVRNGGGAFTSLGHNLDTDGRSGLTNGLNGDIIGTIANPINALLSPLNNHGGPTSTLALLPGSPAINAGTSTDAPALDQRGVVRISTTDIGAFESRGFALALASGNNQTALVNTNFASPLSVTVTNSASEPVNGGQVTFTPPGSGASATIAGNPAIIASSTATTGTVAANGTGGTYNVTASANGAASAVNFSLTNNIAPTVLSIVRGNASPTSNGSVPFNVSFSESVTGVANSNFAVTTSGVAGASVTSVIGSGSTRVVTVNTGTGSGTVGLNMTNSTGVTDSLAAAVSNLPFTGDVYTIDKTAPTASLSASNVTTAGGTSYMFTVTYSDNMVINVASLDSSDVTVAGPGGPLAVTFAGVTPGGNGTPRTASYSITPPGGSWDNADGGSYAITMAANQVTDTLGNAVAAGTLGTFQVLICPSVFAVNDLGDTADATPGNGICANASGNCTLRAAIEEANAITACSPLTINFSVTGTINVMSNQLPAIDHPNLTITGPGASQLDVHRNDSLQFRIFTINSGKTVAISGLTISNGNSTPQDGGGIFSQGTLSLTDCVLSNNTSPFNGGGVASTGPLTVTRCTFIGNSASLGGGIAQTGSTLSVTDSTINGNMANEGGGVYMFGGTNMLTNCTVSSNTASDKGGGVEQIGNALQPGGVTLLNCTITNNTATSGAGVHTGSGDATVIATQMKNTIVAGNNGLNNFSVPFPLGGATVISQGNNLDGDGSSGLTNGVNGDLVGTIGSPINALLAALGNYGGTTQTHALLPGSPAINAGTSTGAPANDQRGKARFGNVDIGAVESKGFTLALNGGTPQTTPVTTAFANPLSVTVAANDANDPVNGGQVTFTPPVSGASATIAGNPVVIASGVATTGTVTANGTVGGPYNVAANAIGAAAAVNFALTNICPTITVNPTTMPTGTAGTAYGPVSFTQMGGNGSITWSVSSNNLPAGLMLDSSTGVLNGTPTVATGVNVTIRATDSGGCFGERTVTIQINCPTITLAPFTGVTTTLTNGVVGESYNQTFTAAPAGGVYTYSIPLVVIPPGLTFDTLTGVLSGNPTTVGTYGFTVTATAFGICTGQQTYSLPIYPACPSSFTVDHLGDTPDVNPGNRVCGDSFGNCTLRAAIEEANAITACTPLTINFSVTGTINLATALPALNHPNLTINGPGANQLDVHRNAVAAFRIFTINSGRTVAISGLSITNGNDPAQAGGIYNAGTLTLTACAISGNTSPQGGGIQSDNILTMTDCTVSNNSASDFAGGLKIFGSSTTLTNCTFSNNQSAHDSSAIETHTGVALTLTNCTIANNQAGTGLGQTGGALFANTGTILKNTIVTNNTGNNANIAGTIDTANSFNNLVGTSGTGGLTNGVNGNIVGVANANTLLAALGNYGGPTQTYALLPGSPAINAGTASGAPANDQRGIARVGNVDIGAFESRGFTLALNGGNNQATIINTAFPNALAVLVSSSFSEPVQGGLVTFTPPGSGASAALTTNPATINASGITSVTATANGTTGGPYTVSASANGASPTINFSLTNTMPPMFTCCPTNQTVNAASGQCTASVSFNPLASGFPAPTITCKIGATTITSPHTFAVGTSNVVCTAANGVAPDATCSFTVTVNDTQNPALTCPTNIVANTAPNTCAASVSYTTPTASDNCSGATVSCSPASGSTFQKGVTTVTCTAMDAAKNTASCSFTVTVNDNQNPSLTCPANITLNTAAGICTAVATYATPVPTDNCAGVTATCTPASGSTFQKGVTTVTCTATDASSNTASCSFTVTVNDNQNPTITCPSNQTATSLTGNPIPVTFPAPTAADNCSGVTTACVPASGSNFAVGTTTVTCTATDASNRTATCSFTVAVVSCTSIACPTDVSVATTGNSATVNYSLPVPTGSCGTITCSPASGSTFNLGVTTVTCASSIGNQSCSFNVTVNRVSGSAFDPLACTGPGNTVQATLVISNNGNVNQTVADTTIFTNLKGVPGSCTVTPNVGTCTVTSGNLTYNATLTPGQTVTLTYLTQVSDLALTGQQVCTNNSVAFNGGNPLAFSVCDVVDCPAVGPGNLIPAVSEASDQKTGSVLIYNVYTSGATSGNTQNTRINITNTHLTLPAFVHLFFVAEGCAVADSYICLTGNQTASFLASDMDPGTTGYLVAVAVNALGCPTNFNYLLGDEYVKFTTGHAANLAAEAFAALPGGLPACDANSNTAMINFDGVSYNRTPATLALSNVGSRADGNDTLLIVNRIGGNLGIGAATLGTLFGILYDDAENALSFSVSGNCQLRNSITNNFPRTTPRFESFIPAGRSGWLKIYNQTGAIGMTGAAINFNPNATSSAGAFNQGHNLHALTLNTTNNYVIPVFPPSC